VFDCAQLHPLYAFGSEGNGFGELDDPCGVAAYDGKLFICDRCNSRLHVFRYNGAPLAMMGGAQPPTGEKPVPGTFLGPSGIACKHGLLFIVDSMGTRCRTIQVFSADTHSLRQLIRMPGLSRAVGCGVTDDHLYVADAIGAVASGGVDGRLVRLDLTVQGITGRRFVDDDDDDEPIYTSVDVSNQLQERTAASMSITY